MRRKARRFALALLFAWGLSLSATQGRAQGGDTPPASGPGRFVVVGDAIPQALSAIPGDPARGRAIVADRAVGLCLLCHTGPIAEERFQGDIAPELSGAGSRWSEGQLRLRLVDARRLNPQSIMPSYYRVEKLVRVNTQWRGKPVLSAQQIEDVVAYLRTLRTSGDGG
ncbi:MAG: sulfur oxidation c-type cytochrome SoxX [Burkholderiaceae bacterium]